MSDGKRLRRGRGRKILEGRRMWKDVIVAMNRREQQRPAWQAFTFLLRAVVGETATVDGESPASLRIPIELDPEHLDAGAQVARLRAERTGYQPRSSELLREAIGRGFHLMLAEETEARRSPRGRKRA
jgi:hypothetical protein